MKVRMINGIAIDIDLTVGKLYHCTTITEEGGARVIDDKGKENILLKYQYEIVLNTLSDLGFEEGANQGWFFKLDKGELWVYPDKIEFLDDDFTTVTLSEYKNIEQVENILKALQI